MKPEDITTQFSERTVTFDPISGQPTDSDIFYLIEAIAQILLLVPYDEVNGDNNLISLVYSKAAYMAEYTKEFPRPNKPWIYDTSIADNAPNGLRATKEAVHKAVRRDYSLFEAAERGVLYVNSSSMCS